MTAHKHFKHLVRTRMSKTGETYTTARRHIIRQAEVGSDDGPTRWHLPGSIPATTALRVLLTAAGVRDPRNGQPLTEAMLFGICGGIGAGATSFYYEKADFSSFFISGRHLWNDDLAYLKNALARFGIEPVVRETSGRKGADKQLREALTTAAPCIAWVDMTHLPHRGMPAEFSGGGYHLVTVYQIDDARGYALIGDLTDTPIQISLDQLGLARERIKQFKNRLLSIPPTSGVSNLGALIDSGLRAGHQGLKKGPGKGAATMSGLEAIGKWAAQLRPSDSKDSWSKMFPRGHRLWMGLTFIHDFIENYHTGGGLCRPLFAEFLAEAAEVSGDQSLRPLSKRYAELGAAWNDVALTAIPQHVPAFREVRELCARRAELRTAGEPDSADKIRDVWASLSELRNKARSDFPLSQKQCDDLLTLLHGKVTALHEAEVAARDALGQVLP